MSYDPIRHGGMFGGIVEAGDIASELSVSAEEAIRIQRERQAERLAAYHAEQAAVENNVIQFRPRA